MDLPQEEGDEKWSGGTFLRPFRLLGGRNSGAVPGGERGHNGQNSLIGLA
jgi:hypothetical protein